MLKLSHHVVTIPTSAGNLTGFMSGPMQGHALVIFAHGSGSSRLSPRNRFVAEQLEASGFGTLLFDLLTENEDLNYQKRFDILLLANRLEEAYRWALRELKDESLPVAFIGASTGAAAALVAAASLGTGVKAVVSRGGRPDLAHDSLYDVCCPTLFIVGELDTEVIELNEIALSQIPDSTIKSLEIVPQASHLFEERGALERVAELARDWLWTYARTA